MSWALGRTKRHYRCWADRLKKTCTLGFMWLPWALSHKLRPDSSILGIIRTYEILLRRFKRFLVHTGADPMQQNDSFGVFQL